MAPNSGVKKGSHKTKRGTTAKGMMDEFVDRLTEDLARVFLTVFEFDRMIDDGHYFQLAKKDQFPLEGNCNVCGRCGPRDKICGHCYDRFKQQRQHTHIYGAVLNEEKKKMYVCRIQFRPTIMRRDHRYMGDDKTYKEGTWDLYSHPKYLAVNQYNLRDADVQGRVVEPKIEPYFLSSSPTVVEQHMYNESINKRNDEIAVEQMKMWRESQAKK